MRFTLVFMLVLLAHSGWGQAIGQWQSYYPYKTSSGVATDGKFLFSAAGSGFFSYDAVSGTIVTHSKVDGMSDAGTDRIGYDTVTKTVIVTYANGNVDLFQDNSFYNIPDLRLKNISSVKAVSDVYAVDGKAYLSTSFGIVVLDLRRNEVKESYEFTLNGQSLGVTAVRRLGGSIWASTPHGLYRAAENSRTLQAFSTWQRIGNSDSLTSLAVSEGRLWATAPAGMLRMRADASGFDTVYRSRGASHVDPGQGYVWLSENFNTAGAQFGRLKKILPDGSIADSFRAGMPMNVVMLSNGAPWIADNFEGLFTRENQNSRYVIPDGPRDLNNFDIRADAGNVWIGHGVYTNTFFPRDFTGGMSYKGSGTPWNNIGGGTIADVVTVLPENDGVYFGSMQSGLYFSAAGKQLENVTGPILEPANFDAGRYAVISVARDLDGNLLVGQYQPVAHEVSVRTKAGSWVKWVADESGVAGGATHTAAGLLVDDANQKWWFQPQGGGVFVYDDARTPENIADDRNIHLTVGKGTGGLPSAFVLSMVKDRDGAIWVGTNNGIGIYSCAGSIIRSPCDADWPIVQFDAFAGRLFENERVNTIAVDGGNRKWVGTNNGVWLLSPDAQKIVSRFTADNSPMPSNTVQKITVDNVTGDVYIGTDRGLVSYRGTATGGAESAGSVQTFPNPVPSGYSGTIAIRGLTTDADVRITDISGQLIYRANAAGGQAVWNGLDYTGRRPQSGVYLVLVTNKDGSQTAQGKLVFLE